MLLDEIKDKFVMLRKFEADYNDLQGKISDIEIPVKPKYFSSTEDFADYYKQTETASNAVNGFKSQLTQVEENINMVKADIVNLIPMNGVWFKILETNFWCALTRQAGTLKFIEEEDATKLPDLQKY